MVTTSNYLSGTLTIITDSNGTAITTLTSAIISGIITALGASASASTIIDLSYSNATSIAAGAFSGYTSLTSITIPASVTSIGASAFQGCSALASVTFNSNPTLGANAFTGIIGSSITTLHTFYTSNSELISLKAAGFTATQLHAAGFTDADILAINKASYDVGGIGNYATKLTNYKQKYADYLAALKNGSHELKLQASNTQYSDGTLIDNQYALNSGECIALCSRTNTCTGATFNSDQNSCNIYSGPGHTNAGGGSASYAIISDIQTKLYDFNVAAKTLSLANQAVETDLNSGDATVFNAKTGQLQTTYTDLLQDRQNIDEATQQFNKLNNTNINASIGITASSNQNII